MVAWTDIILSPFQAGFQMVTDLWTLSVGTPAQKANVSVSYLPNVTGGSTKTYQSIVGKAITVQSQTSPELKKAWNTPTLLNTEIAIPPLPDILGTFGKYANLILFGGLAIVGIWAYGKVK